MINRSLWIQKFKKMSLYVDKTFKSLGTENKKLILNLKRTLQVLEDLFTQIKTLKKEIK